MGSARITFIAVAYLVTLACVLAAPRLRDSRILEGENVNSGEFPWVVSIRVDNAYACVGSIISNRSIITAAHCITELAVQPISPQRVSVRVGSINKYAGGKIVQANQIRVHPSFGNFVYDFAVINLKEDLEFSDRIQPIELGTIVEVPEGTEVTITGWGLQLNETTPYKLQQATMTVMERNNCEYVAGFGYESVHCLDHPEKQGACRGDDGAGIVNSNLLYGVYSFSFGTCGTKYPDVAGNVPYVADWIKSVMA